MGSQLRFVAGQTTNSICSLLDDASTAKRLHANSTPAPAGSVLEAHHQDGMTV
jgi:hypothetical protein